MASSNPSAPQTWPGRLAPLVVGQADTVVRHTMQTAADAGVSLLMKNDILDVLAQEAVQSIDFKLAGWTINSGSFNSVRSAILQGRINATLLLRNDARFPEYATIYDEIDAVYDKKLNVFLLKERVRADRRKSLSSIVHESVHASQDIARNFDILRLHTEAAAFVAEAVFLRNTQGDATRRPDVFMDSPPGQPDDDVLKHAWSLGTKIVASPGISIPDGDADLQLLCDAIKKTDLYSTVYPWYEQAGYDGV